MDEPILITVIKAALLVFIAITGFAYMTLWERKLIGRFQTRYGPNRVGPMGYLQPLADIIKLALKEDFAPAGADRILYRIAPLITMFAAVAGLAVIPYGESVEIFGHDVTLYGASLDIDVLYLFALSGLGFYGLILGGWASGNKYSLLGSARTAAQLISYEVSMGLAVIGVIMMAGSLNLLDIVHAQADTVWYIVYQPLGFLVFLIAGVAEVNRAPFDLPEAESELVAGYQTEYGGMGYAVYPAAEYANMIVLSAFTATLFLGGFSGPFLPGFVWLLLKMIVILFFYIWLRATLPRLRYDRLMQLGWKILLPLATVNFVVTAIVVGIWFSN